MSYERSSVMGGTYSRPAADSAKIQFRRALTLTFMTLVMPGSAQLVMGSKKIGRIAIRIWLLVLAAMVFIVFLAMTSRVGFLRLMLNSTFSTCLRLFLLGGAVAWVGLMVDAWRLGRPRQLDRNHRLVMTGLNGVLCFVTAGAMFFGAHLVAVQKSFVGTVFAADTVSKPADGRYNILLLGGDSGPDRSGLRPDSLTVASIDKETGRTVLVGLPRNLQDVPFPKGSVMAKQWPNGFNCATCELNAVNTWANDHKALFPGVKDPGLQATIQAVEATTALHINYYAMVNMAGLTQLIDAVGGVTVNVKEKTAIGGVGSPIRGYIPAGKHKLTGDQATWYARSRVQNDDFSRMGRQKCVMSDMLHQLSPQKVLLNVEKIADSSKALLTTSIPQKDLPTFVDLALKAKSQKISTVSLVPPVIYTGNPNFAKVRRIIATAIGKAEGKSTTEGGVLDASLPKVDPNAADSTDDPKKANTTDDLESTC